MDIRIVESLATSGGLKDPSFRVDPSVENISLNWDESLGTLSVVDYNMDYSILPWQLYGDVVKKVFLTYNGKNCSNGQLVETVVMESSSEDDINQIPGFNNSNEWAYTPSTLTYPSEIKEMTDISEFATSPYDYSQGFTVVKQFLTAEANASIGDPMYKAFYRAPHLTSFIPPNVEGNKVYTDGWYTSYVCAVRTWTSADPVVNGSSKGDIVFYGANKKFYLNITGVGGTLITDPDDSNAMIPDTTNWQVDPNFADWQSLMMDNTGDAMVDDPIYFIETQHLVTVELNKAILKELKAQCNACTSNTTKFGVSAIANYMKLMQKRLGAWVQFNADLYHEASNILESSRKLCYQCLYHPGEYNSINGSVC